MSEPSFAITRAITQLSDAGYLYLGIAGRPKGIEPIVAAFQQAIDAALAEKDKEIARLKAALEGAGMLERSQEACEKRIAELEERNRYWKERNPIEAEKDKRIDSLGWNVALLAKRLSSLQALMERSEHAQLFVGDKCLWICVEDCPRCAYQKLLEEWK